ncbi:hypothetical protein JCM9492_07890 [Aquifex pyrophilus]
MALKRKIALEDFVLAFTILLTFSYPFIITFFILYKEHEKRFYAKSVMEKVLKVLVSENCEEMFVEVIPHIHKGLLGKVLEFEEICSKTAGKNVIAKEFIPKDGEFIYRIKLSEGRLSLVGIWEGETFRVILIDYD